MAMMTCRSTLARARWALALVLTLVFSQVALAAYACRGVAVAAGNSHAECVAAAERQGAECDSPPLCWAHCQHADQSADRADSSPLAWAAMPVPPFHASLSPAPGGVSGAIHRALPRTAPPVRIVFCRLRN